MPPIDHLLQRPSVARSLAGLLAGLTLAAASTNPRAQPAPAPGFSCVLLGRAGLQVRSAGAVVEAPVRLLECEGATALADGLSVCYVNERRERRCRDLRKGDVVTRSAFGGGTGPGLGDTVVAMARGDVQTLPGQTRTSNRVVGLPFGQVIGDAGALTFDFSLDPRVAGATRLQITIDADNGSTVWESTIETKSIKAPLAALQTDAWYRWVAQANGRRSTGRFLLLGGTASGVRGELQQIDADAALSEPARQFLKAEILTENALMHEGLLAINELRRLTEPR